MIDRPAKLDIFQTTLPMRGFRHAAARRDCAEAIVVRLVTQRGREGWGETLPRDYVTGETLETVAADLERIFWPMLVETVRPDNAAKALADLPTTDGERVITAARCAAELAATMAFDVQPDAQPEGAAPRVSGVLGAGDPAKMLRKLKWMRRFGLRHFKLKLGIDDETDRAALSAVHEALGPDLAEGKASLRVDANMGWLFKDVPAKVAELAEYGVLAVEQPCRVTLGRFVDLAEECVLPLIADESLRTVAAAEVLLGAEGKIWPNVRISKCGGLGPARRIAQLAAAEDIPWVLGCMVGESGLLSTAQRTLLASAPPPAMVEGNYGPFLLKDDLVQPSPRFGYGGRLLPGRAIYQARPNVRKVKRYGRCVATLRA